MRNARHQRRGENKTELNLDRESRAGILHEEHGAEAFWCGMEVGGMQKWVQEESVKCKVRWSIVKILTWLKCLIIPFWHHFFILSQAKVKGTISSLYTNLSRPQTCPRSWGRTARGRGPGLRRPRPWRRWRGRPRPPPWQSRLCWRTQTAILRFLSGQKRTGFPEDDMIGKTWKLVFQF